MMRLLLAAALCLAATVANSGGVYNPPTTIGGSPATVTLCQNAAQVAHTGNTNETALATCAIPAGAMGANGQLIIRVLWSATNNANNKSVRARFSTISGTIISSSGMTTQVNLFWPGCFLANRNSASSQIANFTACGNLSGTQATAAINTAVATTLVLTGQLTTGTDTVAIEAYTIQLLPKP